MQFRETYSQRTLRATVSIIGVRLSRQQDRIREAVEEALYPYAENVNMLFGQLLHYPRLTQIFSLAQKYLPEQLEEIQEQLIDPVMMRMSDVGQMIRNEEKKADPKAHMESSLTFTHVTELDGQFPDRCWNVFKKGLGEMSPEQVGLRLQGTRHRATKST